MKRYERTYDTIQGRRSLSNDKNKGLIIGQVKSLPMDIWKIIIKNTLLDVNELNEWYDIANILSYTSKSFYKILTCMTCQYNLTRKLSQFENPLFIQCNRCYNFECNTCFTKNVCNICIQLYDIPILCGHCYKNEFKLINECEECHYAVCNEHTIEKRNITFCSSMCIKSFTHSLFDD